MCGYDPSTPKKNRPLRRAIFFRGRGSEHGTQGGGVVVPPPLRSPAFPLPLKLRQLLSPPLAFAAAPAGGSSNPLEQYVRRCLFPTTQKNNSQGCFAWLRHFALDCYFSVWFYGNTDGTKCPEGVQSARADTRVIQGS